MVTAWTVPPMTLLPFQLGMLFQLTPSPVPAQVMVLAPLMFQFVSTPWVGPLAVHERNS